MIPISRYSILDGVRAVNLRCQIVEISCQVQYKGRPRWFIIPDGCVGEYERIDEPIKWPMLPGLGANRFVTISDITALRSSNLLTEDQTVAAVAAIMTGTITQEHA